MFVFVINSNHVVRTNLYDCACAIWSINLFGCWLTVEFSMESISRIEKSWIEILFHKGGIYYLSLVKSFNSENCFATKKYSIIILRVILKKMSSIHLKGSILVDIVFRPYFAKDSHTPLAKKFGRLSSSSRKNLTQVKGRISTEALSVTIASSSFYILYLFYIFHILLKIFQNLFA